MAEIDKLARVEDGAVIGEGTSIGPFCHIGSNVTIGANCKLLTRVTIAGHTTIGDGCVIHPGAVLGGSPQDLSYRGEPHQLIVGASCTIREGVTMNVGTTKGGGVTRVGARGFFMSNAHIAHDCIVGNDVIFATSATLGGHCEIGDFVYFGGLSAAHQFVRIGSQAMIGGLTGLRGDVIPYGLANGQHAHLEGLNVIGMRRRKFTRERVHTVRSFYNDLFYSDGTFEARVASVETRRADDPAIAEILDFIAAGDKRPLCNVERHGRRLT